VNQGYLLFHKAKSFRERFNSNLINGDIPDQLNLQQLYEWCSNLGRDSAGENLKRRLQLYRPSDTSDTKWSDRLTEILSSFLDTRLNSVNELPFNSASSKIPFQEALAPFVLDASDRIRPGKRFDETVIIECQRILLIELSKISAQCFYESFKNFSSGLKENDGRSSKYDQFIDDLYQGAILKFFQEYSSLAQLFIITLEKWEVRTNQFFQRIDSDYEMLSKLYFGSEYMGTVSSISYKAMISHDQYGSVAIATFQQGQKIVYKPRSSKLDFVYEGVVKWFNAEQSETRLSYNDTLDRGQYSWHAFVDYLPCKSEEGVKEFYHQLGSIAAILQVTGARDYHYGNIIANGRNPILIDNETLFTPNIRVGNNQSSVGDRKVKDEIDLSIARGLLLRDTLMLIYPNPPTIVGAFSQGEEIEQIKFEKINQDTMLMRKRRSFLGGKNIPTLTGNMVDPKNYAESIIEGYSGTLKFLMNKTDSFHQLIVRLTNNFDCDVRLLIRPTAYYSALLTESLEPKYMRNGIDRGIHFEKLAELYVQSKVNMEINFLLNEELSMVESFYLPWFHVRMNQRRYLPELKLEAHGIITRSAEEVFNYQLKQIESGSYIKSLLEIISYYFKQIPPLPHNLGLDNRGNSSALNAKIRHTAHNIKFIYQKFLNPNIKVDSHTVSIYNLYDGLLGPVLCWGACYHIYGEESFKNSINDITQPLLSCIMERNEILYSEGNVGGSKGLGSILYVLIVTYEFTKEKKYLNGAKKLAKSHLSWSNSDDLSIESGLSGYLLSLIKVCSHSKSSEHKMIILNKTKFLIDIIKKKAFELNIPFFGWGRGWPGILYTLCRLYSFHPDQNFKMEIIEIVRSYNLMIKSQLHQLRESKKFSIEEASMFEGVASWTLMMLSYNKTFRLNEEESLIDNYVLKLTTYSNNQVDYITYGVTGIVEVILSSQDKRKHLSNELIDFLVLKFEKNQRYSLNPKFFDLSFFEGISGIIYQQLRLLYVDRIPSAITLD
jgi:type 2 lantibiotic biosynthesis protein LanM